MTTIGIRPAVAFGDTRLAATFWKHVEVQANGCWLWTGASQGRAPAP